MNASKESSLPDKASVQQIVAVDDPLSQPQIPPLEESELRIGKSEPKVSVDESDPKLHVDESDPKMSIDEPGPETSIVSQQAISTNESEPKTVTRDSETQIKSDIIRENDIVIESDAKVADDRKLEFSRNSDSSGDELESRNATRKNGGQDLYTSFQDLSTKTSVRYLCCGL